MNLNRIFIPRKMIMQTSERQNPPSVIRETEIQSRGLFKDLAQALSDVIPVLDKIKETIEDSTGKIPNASRQLHSVTQATESATVEILNVLEVMTKNIEQAIAGLEHLASLCKRRQDALRAIAELLRDSSDPAASRAAQIARQHDEETRPSEDARALLEDMRQSLIRAKESSMDIAMALQVQDITTQQIAGVTHMIESVRTQLGALFSQMGEAGEVQPKSFDTNAQYVPAGDRQTGADAIVEQWKKATP